MTPKPTLIYRCSPFVLVTRFRIPFWQDFTEGHYMTIDLDELPKRMRNLEKDAFLEFMLAFGLRLRRLFRHWGVRNAEAESLATSCLTDIALKVDQFTTRGPGSFERWVLHLARHAWIDEWRKRERASPLAD